MACYHPLVGLAYGPDLDGKFSVFIKPQGYDYEMLERIQPNKVFDLPCGHCIGCRQDQSKEWSNRLIMESLYHDFTHFVTLTYCDEYAPIGKSFSDPETGELKQMLTLRKRDIQLFMKRLRKKYSDSRIRFYFAGEYGDQTNRPHYHGIIFGLPENKMQFIPCGKSQTGNPYFRCPDIESVWTATDRPLGCNAQAAKQGMSADLLGFVSVEPANFYTMKYVCAYVTKKLGAHPNEVYIRTGREAPFSLSSRKPGIGLQYLEEHPDVMKDDKIIIAGPTGKVEFAPPRYFKKKFKDSSPDEYQEIADRHLKAAADRLSAELSRTDLSKEDYLL